MFINYFKRDLRKSPFNVSFVRAIFGCYLLWKFLTMVNWGAISSWPVYLNTYSVLVPTIPFISYEK